MTETVIINWVMTPGAKELLDRSVRPPLRQGLPPRETLSFKPNIKALLDEHARGWSAISKGAELHVTFPHAPALQWFIMEINGEK